MEYVVYTLIAGGFIFERSGETGNGKSALSLLFVGFTWPVAVGSIIARNFK